MRTTTKALALLLLAAPGCVALTDFGALRPADAGTSADAPGLDDVPGLDAGDAGRSDGGSPDGGACAAACAADESCCDGICVTTDTLANCRGCGVVCSDGANATASCGAAGCELTCDEGWDDCDAEPGCETDLRAASDCGECGNSCATGLSCALRGGAYTCVTECSGGEVECDGSCTDLGTDPRHCGSCGMDCGTRAGATASCSASGCAFACNMGRGDCNADLASASGDGCETSLVPQYPDADGDGAGDALAVGTPRCPGAGFAPTAGDCDDTSARRAPGLPEECDSLDNDCDLVVDDGFVLGGTPRTVGDACSCEAGAGPGRIECATATSVRCAYPTETCNGRDDDCTGGPDDTFACVQGATTSCRGTGAACSYVGTETCTASCTPGGCAPPPDTCDGNDENCNGFVDEAVVPFGTPTAFTSASAFGANGAWDATAGGAVVAAVPGTTGTRNQLIFARFDRSGRPTGTPLPIDDHPLYGLSGDVGWDGTQWVVMYSRFNDTRGLTEILRVHVNMAGVLSRPTGVVADAESVAIATGSGGGVLGVVTARFLGPTNAGMQFGTYAAGAFTRPLGFLTTAPMTSSALVAPALSNSFYAVGTDATGLFYQRFDATGTLGALARPTLPSITEALAVDSDGTNVVVLSLEGSGTRLSAWSSSPTPSWTTLLRPPGFRGTVGVLGSELWTSFNDVTSQRVRPADGAPYAESYRHACDAFVPAPALAVRGFCIEGANIVPISRCP